MTSNQKKKAMIKLRKKGKTYQEIGNEFNVSRQRVHQILTGYDSPSHLRAKAQTKIEKQYE